MKLMPLTQGKVAVVDDTDFEWLNQWKWHAVGKQGKFYATRRQYLGIFNGKEKYKTIYMARLIAGTPENLLCDHRDGNGLNNQRHNLRNCTKAQNQQNRGRKVILHQDTKMYIGMSKMLCGE